MTDWLDRNLKLLLIGFGMLLLASWVVLKFVEERDRHAACVEALKSKDVGDLVRHLACK